jgi:phage-related protein
LKPVRWLGDSKKALDSFPASAQDDLGFELYQVQQGRHPSDSKPMPSIGAGVEEIRVWVESGTYRVIYLARLADAVYVLHAFQKKTQKTAQSDIALARERLQKHLRSLK